MHEAYTTFADRRRFTIPRTMHEVLGWEKGQWLRLTMLDPDHLLVERAPAHTPAQPAGPPPPHKWTLDDRGQPSPW